jgi:hypothetical protein
LAREVDGVARLGESSDLVEPQQHDAPRHFGPHLQALACEAASNGCEPDTVDAWISAPNAHAITIADRSRAPRRMLGEWEGRTRTGNQAYFKDSLAGILWPG